MPSKIVCVSRGSDDVENAFKRLDESQVQLLYTRFPVGTGTFKRNKYIYIIYIGPNCSIVKRGKGIAEISAFSQTLDAAAGITVTEKSTLSLSFLVQHVRKFFVTDAGNFSLEKIQDEYKRTIKEEQRKMHRDIPPPIPVSSSPPVPMEEAAEEKGSPAQSLTSIHTTCEMDANAQRVLDALHAELGPLNWATFEANPNHLTIADAGNGGIFELVKHLPETKWLFGLFRIALGNGADRMWRVIFFQWIGNKFRAVKQNCTTRIFPRMTVILAPYAYEIYLVGANDLKPQSIIDKSRYAFGDAQFGEKPPPLTNGKLQVAKAGLRHPRYNFTEAEYTVILEEERKQMDLNFDFIRPKRKSLVSSMVETKIVESESRIFDTSETLRLINQSEGGLIWGIFEVR